MKKKLSIENWNRKEHFEFFAQFDEPFHSVTVEIDCTRSYRESKSRNWSFSLLYLHKSLAIAHQIKAFKLRISDGEVFEYDHIVGTSTVLREDGTFGFSYLPFHRDFGVFQEIAQVEFERVKQTPGLDLSYTEQNLIHYSTLPWLRFTSLSHARSFSHPDSCPKISFGKLTHEQERWVMPISISVHHGLVDGKDVGEFVQLLEEIL